MKQKHLSQLLVIVALLVSLIVIGSAAEPLTPGQQIRGDCNGDGAINMKDVLILRKYIADLPVEFADHICSADPSETQPTAPSYTEPSETQPSYTEPSYTQPSETQPSYTEPSETQPSETQPSYTEPSYTQPSETQPSETQPSETQPSETQPSETQPSYTQPSYTQPSYTEPSYTVPSYTEPSQTQPSVTQPSQTQPSQTDGYTVQLNVVESIDKYGQSQTRDDSWKVDKGSSVELKFTFQQIYKGDTEGITKAAKWTSISIDGGVNTLTPSITAGDIANQKADVYVTYTFTANSDVTVTGTITRNAEGQEKDFEPAIITVNGKTSGGGSIRTTPIVTDPDYPACPDMVTLAFNDPATCEQYGILWHTYKELASPVIQYLEGNVTDVALFAANAQSISTISKSTGDAKVTLDYDPANGWTYGSGMMSTITQYTYKGVLPKTLTAGATYSYRVGDAATGVFSQIYTFTYNPSSNSQDGFSFVFLNDTQFSEGPTAGTTYLKNILSAAQATSQADFGSLPQLVMHGGDFISTNTNTFEYGNIFGSNGDFFAKYPMFGTLGNHDAEKKYFLDNWNVSTGDKSYYSFSYGPMHVVVLDNSSDGLKRLNDTQISFLQSDLAANASKYKWNFVMLHRPVYGAVTYNQNAKPDDPDNPTEYWEYGKPSLRYRMTDVCNQYGVDFVFQAHCHQYMRSYPITDYTKSGLSDDTAIKNWDKTNDASYVQMDGDPTMVMENGTNYYVNPKGTIYGTFSTAGSDPDKVFSGSNDHKDGYSENKWVAYAANGQKYSFTACNINGNYFTLDHCYLTGTTVNHYENTRGYGIKKAG